MFMKVLGGVKRLGGPTDRVVGVVEIKNIVIWKLESDRFTSIHESF